MRIGCPKEIKTREFRVGLTPSSVREYVLHGHEVVIETGAGDGIHAEDDDYIRAGAKILPTAADVFAQAEMVVKVKEPQMQECKMLRPDQILFTYLHLAADPAQAEALMKSGAVAIAYETVTSARGGLPLLAPMSEVAGRMSLHVGAYHLHAPLGGSGILIGGVPGVSAANVVILGGGVAGTHAAKMAAGLEARVVIIEKSLERIRQLEDLFANRVAVIYSTEDAVERYVPQADLVVCSVLIPGARAPKMVTRDLLKKMKPRSVIVDIAIDQGGCTETSRPTTHDDPTFEVDGIVHYCVANMPGAVPQTAAAALNNAVLPYGLEVADKGWRKALRDNVYLRHGLNVCKGKVTHPAAAAALGLEYTDAETLLK